MADDTPNDAAPNKEEGLQNETAKATGNADARAKSNANLYPNRWKPGQSGNPAGRKLGSRTNATLLAQALLDGEGQELVRVAVEKAKKGDVAALRLCIERLIPVRKDAPITFELPEVSTVSDALVASEAVLQAVKAGKATPEEASKVLGLLTAHKGLIDATDFEARLAALEERAAAK